MSRSVLGSCAWCYLCGARIPDTIANHSHPLFGTVDHLVPTSKGGSHGIDNRRPAHRLCNQKKGDWSVEALGLWSRVQLQNEVMKMLRAHKDFEKYAKTKEREAATGRIGAFAFLAERNRAVKEVPLRQWEDDGGAVVGAYA